jgi:hypothetical protein
MTGSGVSGSVSTSGQNAVPKERGRNILLFIPLLAICGATTFAAVRRVGLGDNLVGIGDWFALWSAPVIARSLGASALYDMPKFYAAQVALGLANSRFGPFPYPPTFLTMLWPIGDLSVEWGFAIWSIITFGFYLIIMGWKRTSDPRWFLPVVILSPASISNFLAGQTGFLSSFLFVGSLRLLGTYPRLAGVLIGLLTFKPQLGILIPVALIASRKWQTIFCAAATTVTLGFITAILFGWRIWLAWWHVLGNYWQLSDSLSQIDNLSPTISANLRLLGTPHYLIVPAQIAMGTLAAVIVWRVWRRFDPAHPETSMLALCAATFLATPHALFYDLTMVSSAVILYMQRCLKAGQPFAMLEVVALLFGFSLPAIHGSGLSNSVSLITLFSLLWVAFRSVPTQLGR